MHQDHGQRAAAPIFSAKPLATGLLLALALSGAQAQVQRCSDAAGNISYTDGHCPQGSNGVEIEAAKTPEQIAIEQQRAAQARERLAQERINQLEERRIQAETAALEASARASAAAEAAARIQSYNYADSLACREATRQLQRSQSAKARYSYEEQQGLLRAQDAADKACLSPQDYAALLRERGARPSTTIVLTPPPLVYPPTIEPPWGPPGHRPPPGFGAILVPPINMPRPPIQRPLPESDQAPLLLRPAKPAAQSGVRSPARPD